MDNAKYQPVPHDHASFLKRAMTREGFRREYEALDDEYSLVRELLEARRRAGLTQEEVAERMRTTKSAISRLESVGKHSPSILTLRRYAETVGCAVEIRLVAVEKKSEKRTAKKVKS